MEIISWTFPFFVIGTLLIYYLLPRRKQNVWLLVASYFFYATWDYKFAVILFLVTILNYYLAKRMASVHRGRKTWLWVGITSNLSLLVFFRLVSSGYLDQLLINSLGILPSSEPLSLKILLPLGLSFYILQAISYLVDVYQRQIPPSDRIIDFSLYLVYFPKLISGPIERARDFLPKLRQIRQVTSETISRSSYLILIGVIRKLILAQILFAVIPETMFSDPYNTPRRDLWLGLLVYGFWLYNDFCGYTSIIRGVSGFFGLELSANFAQPFFSTRFVDFWNRWHISLSHWLRDYIYLPLSRFFLRRNSNPLSPWVLILPPLATMLASGLWHNFGFYMVAWGGLHAFYQILERLEALLKVRTRKEPKTSFYKLARILLVNILLLPTWIVFGSGGFSKALRLATALFLQGDEPKIRLLECIIPVLAVAVSIAIDAVQFQKRDEAVFYYWPRLGQAGVIAAAILALGLLALWNEIPVASFVYQGF